MNTDRPPPPGVPHVVDAPSVPPQPWRNGGGQTRELLVWPQGGDWRLRISRADIDADGPFSAFPQVQRWFTVLQGAGVVLTFADAQYTLKPGAAPLCFDGTAAPGCRLLDGPTQDLNLMARQGNGMMLPVQSGQAWSGEFVIRALYSTVAGVWSGAGQTCRIAAHTLLWLESAGAGAWVFEPQEPAAAHCAWWLGFTPQN